MSEKLGWLVNDCLTCIPNTKTIWHDLLEAIPNLKSKCDTYIPYHQLADKIEFEYEFITHKPHYILRNATFFRKINLPCKTISFLQDCYSGNTTQIEVCNNSDITIFNSNFTYNFYKNLINCKTKIIPIGVDFNFFKPLTNKNELKKELNILDNSILYVGSTDINPKGFNIIEDLIKQTNYNFCLVMKDDYKSNNPRVRVFNKIDHNTLLKVYNACDMIICPSIIETQHLSSIEAGACNLPIIITDVGIFNGINSGEWGEKAVNNNFIECIEKVKMPLYSPREALLKMKLDKQSCKEEWLKVIESI